MFGFHWTRKAAVWVEDAAVDFHPSACPPDMLPKSIDLGLGNPDTAPPAAALHALRDALNIQGAHGYAPPGGLPELKRALCNRYERCHGVFLRPHTQTLVTLGSKDALRLLAQTLLRPGDRVVAPDPTYPPHVEVACAAGAEVVRFPVDDAPDIWLAYLHKHLRSRGTRPRLVLINFPANPTGTCTSLSVLTELVSLARRYRTWLVNDFAYGDLAFDGLRAPSLLQVPRALDIAAELFTMSKSYGMAGWRVGFLCGNARLVQAVAATAARVNYGPYRPLQIAAAYALNHLPEYVEQTRALYERRRNIFCDALSTHHWQVARPSATMFVWARLPPSCDLLSASRCSERLARAGVVCTPGTQFGRRGTRYLRFSLVHPEPLLTHAAERIGYALNLHTPTPALGVGPHWA
ncbi:MAG TPA: aminotransferase class I/II-fold pyridoxal phosphate-dependent enzyme [Acidiferrobacteraceae bacterium]|nr:aminotransferase class I/II-fold pyridoxal phosphate-dependent enzyme [Acidiferrobacteraceae bacterium]